MPRIMATRLTPNSLRPAGKTNKTVTRDVNRLRDLDLVQERSGGLRANCSLVRGMRQIVIDP